MTQSMSLSNTIVDFGPKHCETIHSGQFMVSHYDTETKEDDDDEEISDLYKSVAVDTSSSDKSNINECMEIEKYQANRDNDSNDKLPIDRDLSKLFQCMKLTYR